MLNIREFLKGLRIIPKSGTSSTRQGELEVNSATSKLIFNDGSIADPVVTEQSIVSNLANKNAVTSQSTSDLTLSSIGANKRVNIKINSSTGGLSLKDQSANDILTVDLNLTEIDIKAPNDTTDTGNAFDVVITGGSKDNSASSGNAGNVVLHGGNNAATAGPGGAAVLTGGDTLFGDAGYVQLNGGNTANGNGGEIDLNGGNSTVGTAGLIFLQGGTSNNGTGGDIILSPGGGTTRDGNIQFSGEVGTNIRPIVGGTLDLGATSNRWNNGKFHKIDSDVEVKTPDLKVQSSGGNIAEIVAPAVLSTSRIATMPDGTGTIALTTDGTGKTALGTSVSGTLPTTNGGTGVSGSATFPSSGTVAIVPASGVVHSNGTVLSSSNVSLTTEVTGALPIGNGGTGQITKAPAFDALSPMSASGDIIYGGTSGTGTRLAKGSDGQILTLVSGLPAWAANSGGFTNPMTTGGDLIYGGASGVATRLANGSNGQVLTSSGGTSAPTWTNGASNPTTTTGDTIYASNTATPATLARLAIGTANQVLGVTGSGTIPAYRSINETNTKNYIAANPNAEVDTAGWATYADAAANIPVDGTGGSATNLTFSRSTSSPLRGAGQFSMVQANSTSLQGKGVSYDFTIDAADKAKPLSIQFDYNASSTFVASNGRTAPLNDGTTTTNAGNSDIEVFVYDVTNAVLIYTTPQVITANGANNFTFKGSFQTASNSTSYRLIFHIATTSANATGWTFLFDSVFVGAQPILQGAPVTDWVAYTPTFTGFGTVSSNTFYYKRIGDNLEVIGSVTTGTVTAALASMSLPSGLSLDTNKISLSNTTANPGMAIGDFSEEGVTNSFTRLVTATGTSTLLLYFGNLPNAVGGLTPQNGSTIAASNKVTSILFRVPISGWSSTVQMSNDTDTRVVAALITGDPASATSGNPIIVPTVSVDTHGAYSNSTGRYTVPVSGIYKMYGALQSASAATTLTIYKNAVSTSLAGNLDSNGEATFGSAVSCVAGDLIDLRPGGTVDATNMTLNIERMSGPSAIATTDTVAARYFASATSISGSLATVSWTTKDYDTHTGMSAGTYTVPIAGKYQVNTAIATNGTLALNSLLVMEIQKNGTVVSRGKLYAGGVMTQLDGVISDIISCIPGDTLRFQISSTATSPAIVSSNFENYISICMVGN